LGTRAPAAPTRRTPKRATANHTIEESSSPVSGCPLPPPSTIQHSPWNHGVRVGGGWASGHFLKPTPPGTRLRRPGKEESSCPISLSEGIDTGHIILPKLMVLCLIVLCVDKKGWVSDILPPRVYKPHKVYINMYSVVFCWGWASGQSVKTPRDGPRLRRLLAVGLGLGCWVRVRLLGEG